jgi:hypothetical protein
MHRASGAIRFRNVRQPLAPTPPSGKPEWDLRHVPVEALEYKSTNSMPRDSDTKSLCKGQHATVLQLPATPQIVNEAQEQTLEACVF